MRPRFSSPGARGSSVGSCSKAERFAFVAAAAGASVGEKMWLELRAMSVERSGSRVKPVGAVFTTTYGTIGLAIV